MRFNQDGAIPLNDKPLKLEDQLKYLGSNISSTESNISVRKVWIGIDRLSNIGKSNLSDRLKRILLSFNRISTTVWFHQFD